MAIKLLASLEKQNKRGLLVLSFFLMGVVSMIDYLTGYELAFSFFYLIPVSMTAWFNSRRLGITAAVISAIAWLITDVAEKELYDEGHVYAYVWNAIIVFGFFLIVALLLSALRTALQRERNLARSDYLTGAINSRLFSELLSVEIDRLQRHKRPFTLAYIDIDNFKIVNDQFGHTVGNQVLRAVADQAKQSLRKTDIFARLGGDEFAILLIETDQQAAQIIVPKIQQEIIGKMAQNHWPVTFSIGVLTCINAPSSADEIIKIADELMYTVKRDSKNAVKYAAYIG